MNSDKYGDGPDPYTYPHSQVLINKLGITDDDQFIEMEKDFSELAIMDIEFSPHPMIYFTGAHCIKPYLAIFIIGPESCVPLIFPKATPDSAIPIALNLKRTGYLANWRKRII